jgi:myo-inositol 2-dehydrogenase / D-chiro-inositol 1-dehydrogenase
VSRGLTPVRIGVAGLGGMGTLHATTLARLGGCELVAVAAARPGRASEVAGDLGVDACTYPELCSRSDVEAIVLAARSVDHATVALEVLRGGKHLFLEKPGATTLAGHDALRAESARRPDQVVQIGYMRRFDDGFVDAHRRVAGGEVGTPLVVVMTSRDMEWPEDEDPRDTGGFLLDMASHDYDTACWFFDDEPVEVVATRQALVYPGLLDAADLDNAVVTIRFGRGGIAVTHVSRTCTFGHDVRCEVVGSKGSVFVRGAGDGADAVLDATHADRFPADYRARFQRAYERELEAFVGACLGERPAQPTLADDRRAVAAGVAARASAVAGSARSVGEDWPWP